jgi:serine protease Do
MAHVGPLYSGHLGEAIKMWLGTWQRLGARTSWLRRSSVLLLCASSGLASSAQVVSIADVVDRVLPGVVNIRTRDKLESIKTENAGREIPSDGRSPAASDPFFKLFVSPLEMIQKEIPRSRGSGFFYQSNSFVVTNYHVVKDAQSIEVVPAHERWGLSAKLIGMNKQADLALLKLENPWPKARPLKFASSGKVRIGDGVFAIGNPFGYGHTVTSGILSAKGRTIGEGPFDDFLQTDAAINPGNSGGPLFNLKGDVIGINTALLSDARGISFAIPTEVARPILDALRRPIGLSKMVWFGLGLSNVRPEGANSESVGLLVTHVVQGSPAQIAGIQTGDVLVSMDNKRVLDVTDFRTIVRRMSPGKKLSVGVFRQSKTDQLEMTIGRMPQEFIAGRGRSDLY